LKDRTPGKEGKKPAESGERKGRDTRGYDANERWLWSLRIYVRSKGVRPLKREKKKKKKRDAKYFTIG